MTDGLALSPPRVLSLCSGIGGLDLGVRLALPSSRTVGYIERDAFAAAVLVARMADAALDEAPVWDDLATFDGRRFAGVVDLVVAGFPCQPWSVAGSRRGTDDDRWLWPDIARVVRDVGPSYVFLENVPGLVSGGGLAVVLGDLASLGFDAEWLSLRADEVGAPHRRERVFILGWRRPVAVGDGLAVSDGDAGTRVGSASISGSRTEGRGPEPRLDSGERKEVADTSRRGPFPVQLGERVRFVGEDGPSVADSESHLWGRTRRDGRRGASDGGRSENKSSLDDSRCAAGQDGLCRPVADESEGPTFVGDSSRPVGVIQDDPDGPRLEGYGLDGELPGELPAWPPSPESPDWRFILERWPELAPGTPEPVVRRMADGISGRMDRLRALGNAVVPIQAAVALRRLMTNIDAEVDLPPEAGTPSLEDDW